MSRQSPSRLKLAFSFLLETYQEWQADHPDLLAGGLSYFALFSIAPVMIIATALLGHLWSHEGIQVVVFDKLAPVVGSAATASLSKWLTLATKGAKAKASLFSFIALYLAASKIFAQLRTALDIIWDIRPPEESFFRNIARTNGKNLLMVLGIVLFLFVYLVADAAMTVALHGLAHYMPAFSPLLILELAHFAVPLLLFVLLFGAVYKVLPDTRIPWSDVWPGAWLTSGLFAIGKALIAFYLGYQKFGTLYGAASSVIVIMVWIYFAAQIFFFGAEFTWLYANKYGSRAPGRRHRR